MSNFSALPLHDELEISFGSDVGCREPILERIRMDRLLKRLDTGALPTRDAEGEAWTPPDDDAVLEYPLAVADEVSDAERQRRRTAIALAEIATIFETPYVRRDIW